MGAHKVCSLALLMKNNMQVIDSHQSKNNSYHFMNQGRCSVLCPLFQLCPVMYMCTESKVQKAFFHLVSTSHVMKQYFYFPETQVASAHVVFATSQFKAGGKGLGSYLLRPKVVLAAMCLPWWDAVGLEWCCSCNNPGNVSEARVFCDIYWTNHIAVKDGGQVSGHKAPSSD